MAGKVWGDIDRLHPTIIARLQRAGAAGGFDVSVQDGWRSMADAWKFWNAYQRYLHGGPYAPVAAYPGTSLHMGNAPAYSIALAADITVHMSNGQTLSPRNSAVRPHLYGAKLHDPVTTEDWHWQAIEDRNPPNEHPAPLVPVLTIGSHGDVVKVLQQHLNYLMRGRPGFPIAEDGAYGPGTAAAVRTWQAIAPGGGLAVDGIAGEKTQNSINFFYVISENRYSGQPTVKRGDVGHPAAVKLVQQICTLLGIPTVVDGIFGPGTEANVRAVQRKWGIGVDGVAGPQWWAKADDLMDFIGKPN